MAPLKIPANNVHCSYFCQTRKLFQIIHALTRIFGPRRQCQLLTIADYHWIHRHTILLVALAEHKVVFFKTKVLALRD